MTHSTHSMTSLGPVGSVGSVGASLMEPLPFSVPSGGLGRPGRPGRPGPSAWPQRKSSSSGGLWQTNLSTPALVLAGLLSRHLRRRHRAKLCAGKDEDTSLSEYQLKQNLESLKRRSEMLLEQSGVGSPEFEADAKAIRAESELPDLWNDASHAQKVMVKLRRLEASEKRVEDYSNFGDEVQTALELAKEAEVAGDMDESLMLREEASAALDRWEGEVSQAEVELMMGGKYDAHSCQINIYAGAGGDEACDWVCMLEKMYTNYAEQKGWSAKRLSFTEGDMLGLKSVEFEVEGDYAFGMMQRETGTHRLVRIWNGKRQTTFAGVEVVPVLPDDTVGDLEIDPKDLQWETFRCGGKGGQNVNKLETGVRVIHVPSGIRVRCTAERSQQDNRSKALAWLKAKLLLIQEQQKVQELQAIRGDLVSAEWGAQVRNYVLQPYTMVKDVRSGHERGDADRVLNGDLESHVDALLRMGASSQKAA
eukprot:s46_g28.t1